MLQLEKSFMVFHPGESAICCYIFPPWSEFFFHPGQSFFSTLVRVFSTLVRVFFQPCRRATYCLSKISPTSQSGRFSLPLISEPHTIVVFVLTWLACLHGHSLAKLQLRPAHKNNYSSSTSSTCSSCSITLFSFSPDVDRALMPESFRITNVENQSFSRCSPDSLTWPRPPQMSGHMALVFNWAKLVRVSQKIWRKNLQTLKSQYRTDCIKISMKSIWTWSSWWWTVAAVRSRQLSDGGSLGAIGGHRDLSFWKRPPSSKIGGHHRHLILRVTMWGCHRRPFPFKLDLDMLRQGSMLWYRAFIPAGYKWLRIQRHNTTMDIHDIHV